MDSNYQLINVDCGFAFLFCSVLSKGTQSFTYLLSSNPT